METLADRLNSYFGAGAAVKGSDGLITIDEKIYPKFLELYEEYNSALMDLIGIWWHSFKIDYKDAKGFPLLSGGTGSHKAFDMNERIEMMANLHSPFTRPIKFLKLLINKHDIISYFHFAASETMEPHLLNFLESFTGNPENANNFARHPYAAEVMQKAQKLGRIVSIPDFKDSFSIEEILKAGMTTNNAAVVQYLAIGDHYKGLEPSAASLMTSKVSLRFLSIFLSRIGFGPSPNYAYPALGGTKGLDMDLLQLCGYGHAVGCPAGRRISQKAIETLHELGVEEPVAVTIPDMVEYIRPAYQRHVQEWYINNPHMHKKINKHTRALLEGNFPYPGRH